jgi:hypothetical protein
MSVSSIRVGMNRPTVNTPEAVQGILRRYDLQPELQVVTGSETGTDVLAFQEQEHSWVEWPSAVRVAELPVGSDVDEDEGSEAYDKRHEERGQQGLTDMLLALAPYLHSPLVIQVALQKCAQALIDFCGFAKKGMDSFYKREADKYKGITELSSRYPKLFESTRAALKDFKSEQNGSTVQGTLRIKTNEPATSFVLLLSMMPRKAKE